MIRSRIVPNAQTWGGRSLYDKHPCPLDCSHYYCNLWRRQATALCIVCDQSIGLDHDFYQDYSGEWTIHETCSGVMRDVLSLSTGGVMEHHVVATIANLERFAGRALTDEQSVALHESIDLAVKIAFPNTFVLLAWCFNAVAGSVIGVNQLAAIRDQHILTPDERDAIRSMVDQIIAEYLARLDASSMSADDATV